ncbi:type II toxin-antitoxin system HicB family antitoxin [Halobacteria archaeon HArc-gm2]|nr:type II toxin-antitoxin system HicB family antitoxin [Halobacteria archaeon HArc-gm2]
MGAGEEIKLTNEGNTALWTALDVETGVASQGETREKALENLDEAVVGYEGSGRPPANEELQGLGIDPAENTCMGELPDVLK